jgi:ubiquinone/menaquinone biosynthesis C-methylase UbiE
MKAQQRSSPAEAYEEYFVPAIFDPLTSLLLDAAPPQPGERVLDIACGTGIVARRAASLVGPTGAIVGMDVNPGMIEVARRLPASDDVRVEFRHGDAQKLDLPDGGFDRVVCQQGVQFLADRVAGLREMRRVLVAGGTAALAVWQGPERHPLYTAMAEVEAPHLTAFGLPVTTEDLTAPFSLGDPADLRDLLDEAGFREVDLTQASIEARFATPERFVERLEYAYAAVVPAFVENPDMFTQYLQKITSETTALVEAYRDGDHVVVPMHTHVAVARN